MTHPFAPLSEEEIATAVATVRATGRLGAGARFSTVGVDDRRDRDGRHARLLVVPGPETTVLDVVVDLAGPKVVSWTEHEDARPVLAFDEALNAMVTLHGDERVVAALAARGITDLDKVQIDPWPAGNFGVAAEEGRRIARCICFYREEPEDNGYARPIEGLHVFVDMARGEVVDIIDEHAAPLPPERGSYFPEDHPPRTDLAPLEIHQPEGVSFTVEGSVLRWQKWSMQVSLEPLEGVVLRDIGYEDQGRTRSILRRAAVSEMVVPYGDPDPNHRWKNAFDVGEWGLGRMANSLVNGCDCLGEIRYLDATFADEQGNPQTVENAICIHEEDFGILWKHQDLFTGRTEVRRSRRLVVSSIATVGNYEYGFYWNFYQDGSLELVVKLTGLMSTKAAEGPPQPHAPAIAPGLTAPVHQHLFCVRLDAAVDGPVNEVHEVDVVPMPLDDANPTASGFVPVVTRLESEQRAQRDTDAARSRSWTVVNPSVRNRLGQPVAYRLVPGPTPTLLADSSSSVAARAGFATHNLWVTPYDPEQRYPAGDFPNQHAGGDGLPRWTAEDRSLVGTEVVLWHTFGVTHVPRPEDWPVMPVAMCGFHLLPHGFFDENPSLDVPAPSHCHTE